MSNECTFQSRIFKKTVPVLFSLILGTYSSHSARAQSASQSNSSGLTVSKPLEGQVQLDEKLPPASPNFGVGNKLDSKYLESQTPGNVWHIIPKWMAGKWHSDEEVVSHVHDFHTGEDVQLSIHQKAVSDESYGDQRDKSGQIWSFDGVPNTSKTETANGMTYFVTSKFDRGLPCEANYASKSRFDEIQVNKKGKIARIAQIEQLSTFEQIDDGMMKNHAVAKVFDALGNPVLLQEGDVLWKRSAPYQNKDQKGDLDLKKLFVEFLRQTGQEALLP
jgi:hypothetical protein